MQLPEQKLLTYNEVADTLQVSKRTVYRMAKSGSLPSIRIGATTRFSQDDVSYFVAKRRVGKT